MPRSACAACARTWVSCGARSALAEFTIGQRPLEIAEDLLALQPRILGLGIYIWNVVPATELVALLKRLQPELTIVLGGPEVSYECGQQEIVRLADHVVTGEADMVFRRSAGRFSRPSAGDEDHPGPPPGRRAARVTVRRIHGRGHRPPAGLRRSLAWLPVRMRILPVIAGHPGARVSARSLLAAMARLFVRGVRHFKFIDRTFNLHIETGRRILEFFLARLPVRAVPAFRNDPRPVCQPGCAN